MRRGHATAVSLALSVLLLTTAPGVQLGSAQTEQQGNTDRGAC